VLTARAAARRAKRQLIGLLALALGVLIVAAHRRDLLGSDMPIRLGAVFVLLLLGWYVARDVSRAARPALIRRLNPDAAMTVSFLVRLATVIVMGFVALSVSGLAPRTIAVGGTAAAVIFGLAAQQTLRHVVAGAVLVSVPTVRVGNRVRLQGGLIAGQLEGVVGSLGLLYTTLVHERAAILVPNSVVLGSAVARRREPGPVEVRAHVRPDMRPKLLQRLLEDAVGAQTRSAPDIHVEAVDRWDVLVRLAATPESPTDRLELADRIVEVLSQANRSPR
jgi:small-conductance mechanosensitive channel